MISFILKAFHVEDMPDGSIIPIGPDHINSQSLKWLIGLMDQYRDIRLLWTVVEAMLMLVIAGLVLFFIYKVKVVQTHLKAKYQELDDRMQKIAALHERADLLDGRTPDRFKEDV